MKFLRLDDFLDNERHGLCLALEPQGLLFAEVRSSSAPCPGPALTAAFGPGYKQEQESWWGNGAQSPFASVSPISKDQAGVTDPQVPQPWWLSAAL